MVPHEAFACSCGAGDVVLRESYQPKTRDKLYYACPKSKPRKNYYGCNYFLWKEERVALLISSPGGSSTPSFSPRTSSNLISSPTPPHLQSIMRIIKQYRLLKLKALAWKDKDPNILFNLSFNLPAIERDITNDEDVKFSIDCATNYLYDEIPHLYVRPPKVEARIIPGPVGVIASGCLGDVEKYFKNGKLELVVGVVKSCTPNSLEDMTITLKDPTGTVEGTINYKVFQNEADGYTKSIKVGSILILRDVSVWTLKPSQRYLNITTRNIVKVFDKDT
nr:hypothetical protein [Tanacetum cinerariifolium]